MPICYPLLLYSISHELLLGTLWANDIFSVGDESLANHAAFAG